MPTHDPPVLRGPPQVPTYTLHPYTLNRFRVYRLGFNVTLHLSITLLQLHPAPLHHGAGAATWGRAEGLRYTLLNSEASTQTAQF